MGSSFITCFINDLSITTGSVPSAFCRGDKIKVPFTSRGIPAGSNLMVEMSDASGDFANSITIGTGKSPFILCTIPSSVSPGSDFRLRVKCDSMNVVGADNGLNLTVSASCLVLDTLLPYPNEYGVDAAANIVAIYTAPLESATINSTNIKVFGNSSGMVSGSGVFSVLGMDSIIYDPVNNFFPGESVSVTIKKEIKGIGDKPLVRPYVFDFRVGTTPSSGIFEIKEIISTSSNVAVSDMTHGDLDNDGDVDMVFAEYTTNQIAVGFNNNGLFESYAYFATGESPEVIKLADLDGDSDLDIVTANHSGDHLSVLKNNGSGSFSSAMRIRTYYVPDDLCIADFDGDGDLDIATNNSIVKNDGAGNLTYYQQLPVNNALSISSADIDADGDMDLVAGTTSGVSILLNDGDADFRFLKNSNTDLYIRKIYQADFNLDGRIDFAALNTNSNKISILINQGNYEFSTQNILATIEKTGLADIDGDKDIDLVFATDASIFITKNDGKGAFSEIQKIYIGAGSYSMTLFDLDGDKDIDIATANPWRFTTFVNGPSVSNINSSFNNELVKIYPNPVSDVLYVDTKTTPDMLILFNMQGVEAVREMQATKINTKGLEQGVYILKIVSGDVTLIRKVNIQH
ncbi:MAG: T9SS type A sorting domain-containing protein [Sporocytophaga sp.]|uniref:T9SS type A sorting domain-containing protein n=1 Tax=Sporocytophaga sp. TaxID=2231183 RepID=UPI001B1C27D8|nr:T9SS type A sorting domain-containing protein [Sporocytophaga sp.]MBO9702598.1 T9SS type A sorting domain-containing protein [Sporocytophaga sp.]